MTHTDSVGAAATRNPGFASTVWQAALAVVAALVTALVVGFISLEIDGLTSGYVIGLSGAPAAVVGKRYPWELQVAEFILTAVFLAAYLRFFRSRAARVGILGVLLLVVLFGWSVASTVLRHDPMPVVPLWFGYAGISPVTTALAAAVAIIPGWHRRRAVSPPERDLAD